MKKNDHFENKREIKWRVRSYLDSLCIHIRSNNDLYDKKHFDQSKNKLKNLLHYGLKYWNKKCEIKYWWLNCDMETLKTIKGVYIRKDKKGLHHITFDLTSLFTFNELWKIYNGVKNNELDS